MNINKAHDYLTQSDEDDLSVEEQVNVIIEQSKVDDTEMIDHLDGVQPLERFEYAFTCRDFLDSMYDEFANLKLARDSESLEIYIDNGDDQDPTQICYWHEDEWLEDAETVVPAMLAAMELFYTNPQELLNRLNHIS